MPLLVGSAVERRAEGIGTIPTRQVLITALPPCCGCVWVSPRALRRFHALNGRLRELLKRLPQVRESAFVGLVDPPHVSGGRENLSGSGLALARVREIGEEAAGLGECEGVEAPSCSSKGWSRRGQGERPGRAHSICGGLVMDLDDRLGSCSHGGVILEHPTRASGAW
jgi:hypothetical protein